MNIIEAKTFIKRHESLVSILESIGYGVSCETQNTIWTYVVYPVELKSTIQDLISKEISIYYARRLGPYVYAENEKELALIVRSLLITKGKTMHLIGNDYYEIEDQNNGI